MINYIINFVICSGLLLLVYRAFLGAENLYRFNRFYLLFSLVFSLAVPATTIHVPYVSMPAWDKLIANQPAAVIADRHLTEQTATRQMPTMVDGPLQPQTAAPVIMGANNNADDYAITTSIPQAAISVQAHHDIAPTHHSTRNYLPEILLALYGVVTLLLLLRFIRNSYHITRVVTGSTIIDYQDTKLVLVTDDVTPHSFLKYVFLNKAAYYNKTIEPEIICHEQTHVRQLHSLDVIWIELLQIVFWFNFFIPLYRKAIQLNHEFLADEAVIENYRDTPAYQHLLLAKASQSGSLYLTSQFNYLVTKKRIIMMTKRTTAAIALYKRLALLPVLGVAIFLFSQKSLAQNAKKAQPEKKQPVAKKEEPKAKSTAVEAARQDAPQSVLDEYAKILAKYGIPYKKGEKINYTPEFSPVDKERVTVLYKQMSHNQQQHQYIRLARLFAPPILWFNIKDTSSIRNKAIYVNDKKVAIADLYGYKTKLYYTTSEKAAKNNEVRLSTPAYYKKRVDNQPKMHFIYIPKESWKSTNWPIGGVVFVNKQAQVMPAAQQSMPKVDVNTRVQVGDHGRRMPLLVINGKPFNKPMPAKFNYGATDADYARLLGIDTLDILSISVLKGETGKAAWGSRGENGVIVINTKNGGNGSTDGSTKQPGTKIKSIDKDHQPLIVVDGKVIEKPIPSGFDFATASNTEYADWLAVKPNDIATISILKDAAAAIRWGLKGANGVILITTKHRGG